jgi:hypothetical protein
MGRQGFDFRKNSGIKFSKMTNLNDKLNF